MKTVIIIPLLLNVLFTLNGQNNGHFRTVSVEDGLSNNFIRKIYKDSHGFIWVGTLNGLERFDGISFKSYIKPSEQKGDVYDIIETDPSGLWIATSNGLWKLSHGNGQLAKAGVPDGYQVFCLCRDDRERLLAGTSGGFFILSGDSITHIPLICDAVHYDVRVYGIGFEDTDKCWLATSSGLFFCDYSSRNTRIVRYSYDVTTSFTSLQKTGPHLYLGNRNEGLVKFDILTGQFSEYIDVGNKNILFLTGDNKDNLWVGTDGGGLKKISISKNRVTESYTHDSQDTYSIRSNAVYSFLEDTDNDILWIGTYSTGLSYTINKRFHTYTYNGFSSRNRHIRSFLIKDDKKLIGTRDGFFYIDERTNTIKSFHAGEDGKFLKSNIITKIFPYGKNFLLGTLDGLCIFDPEQLSIKEFNSDPLFSSGGFYDFTGDDRGAVWMATFKGVIKVSPNGEPTRYSTGNSSLIENLAHSIRKDSKGRIWVGTKKGVCYYDTVSATFKKVEILPSSIYSCKITYIYEDRNSCLWFCTETDGLYRVDRELTHFEHYTTNHSLPDNAVTGITEDELGYFWVATHKGLVRCTFTDSKYFLYWISDGLPGLMFNPGACYYEHANNRLWWGNENGLVLCDIEQVNKITSTPPVHFTDFYINGKSIQSTADPLLKSVNKNGDIKLSRFQNSFGFDFVALNYLYPNDNIFEVMLEGYDKNWTLLNKGHTSAYYGDIAPGKYTFRVRLSGYPDSEKHLTIIVKQTWTLLTGIILLFVLCLTGIWFWRMLKALKRQKNTLKRKMPKEGSPAKDYSLQHRALLKLMNEKKPYLDPELKMSHLTAELKCTSKELSLIFKESIKQSFTDFINGYRVEEFKNKIKNHGFDKYTIIALSEQCGFNSRSSFFRIFKKITGITPLEYMKQIKNESTARH
ncbi:MAG: helix-turn-helix domain-containing protein [Tannerella sp.]|jgi:ligand-binding sensor domain-containing protein/AraC-like DNA-binding protein|nr:helix-turn-helix domain-containing protein [Tannerella sp.]